MDAFSPGADCCCETPCVTSTDAFQRDELGDDWEPVEGDWSLSAGRLQTADAGALLQWKRPRDSDVMRLAVDAWLDDGGTARAVVGYDPTSGDGLYVEIHLDSGQETSYAEIGRLDGSYCKRAIYWHSAESRTGDWTFPVEVHLEACVDADGRFTGTTQLATQPNNIKRLTSHEPIATGRHYAALATGDSAGLVEFDNVALSDGTLCDACWPEEVACYHTNVCGWSEFGLGDAVVEGAKITITRDAPADGIPSLIFFVPEPTTVTIHIDGSNLPCGASAHATILGQCFAQYHAPGGGAIRAPLPDGLSVFAPSGSECTDPNPPPPYTASGSKPIQLHGGWHAFQITSAGGSSFNPWSWTIELEGDIEYEDCYFGLALGVCDG